MLLRFLPYICTVNTTRIRLFSTYVLGLISMYWTIIWQRSPHLVYDIMVLNNLLWKFVDQCSLIHASFNTSKVQIGQSFEASESFNIRKDSKSATFSFENDDLSMFKCWSSKAHCASNDWLIWTQKVPKETWRCDLQTSTNCGLSKIRSYSCGVDWIV